MSHPHVLCLGEILYDFLADQMGLPLEMVKSWTPYPGGAPANVATALAKLGTSTGFIGCIGKDHLGEALVQTLQETGVDISGVQRHPTAPTRSVYVTRSEAGDRQFAGFGEYATTDFADTHLNVDAIPADLIAQADFLVLGTLEMAYPESRRAIEHVLDLADEHYVKILLDINWRPVFWPVPEVAPQVMYDLMSRVDFLKVSDEEAKWLISSTDPAEIAHKLDNLEGVLVTAGDQGCAYYLGGHSGTLPAFSVDVEDTTGAGDSFVAGFIHQVCQRGIRSLEELEVARSVALYASAVGALTTTRAGAIAAQPTPAEVQAFLHLQGYGS